jgi:tetratricopeptide (TPR) repeat protein
MSSKGNVQIDEEGSPSFPKGDKNSRSLHHYKKILCTRRSEKTPYTFIDIKIYTCIGTIHNSIGGKEECRLAIQNYSRALSLQQQIFGVKDPESAAASCNNIGTVYYQQQDFLTALQWFEKALNMLSRYNPINNIGNQTQSDLGEDKNSSNENVAGKVNQNRTAEITAKTYSNIGSVHYKAGRYDKAIECYELALCFLRMIKDEQEKNISSIASICTNIASVYSREGNHSKALEYHGEAMAMFQKAFGDEGGVASSLQSIGNEYFRAKNFPKARSTYLRALEIRKHILEENHPAIAATYSTLGCVNCQLGRYTEAIRYNCEAVEIEEARVLRDSLLLSKMYTNLGEALRKAGEYDEALDRYEKAFKIQKEFLGTDHHLSISSILMNMGKIKHKCGDYGAALQDFMKCRLILEEDEGSHSLTTNNTSRSSSTTAKLYSHVASALSMIGDYEEAVKYYTKVLSIQETELGHIHEDTANTYHKIGQTYEYNGNDNDFDKALNYYKLCFASRKEQFGIFDRRTMNAGSQIVRMWIEQCKNP